MLHQVERAINPLLGPVSPLMVPRMLDNMASAQVAITLGLQGPNFGVSSACATGGHAIGESAEIIRRGDATVMLCGGAEACITPLTLAGDEALGALSCRNDAPERASRPFDRGRDGFVLSEGAGVLVLEELSNAQYRGAKTYCEVSGYGATSDAFHETKPRVDGLGAARAMHRAMTSSGISTGQVSAVFAHATSTPGGDKAEGQALKAALGSALEELPVTAIKSTLGHQLGAAGAVQAVAACKAIQEQKLPPTINLDTPDPDCHLVQIPKTVLAMPLRHVLSNSLGFGGHNAILLFSRFP